MITVIEHDIYLYYFIKCRKNMETLIIIVMLQRVFWDKHENSPLLPPSRLHKNKGLGVSNVNY